MSINRSLHRIAKEGVVQTLEAKDKEIERLHSIIKEVRELRKKISNCYYEDGFELDTPMLLEYIDKILDKENK